MTAWTIRPCEAGDEAALALVGAATFLESYAGELRGSDILAHCRTRHAESTYAGWLGEGAAMWLAQAEGGAPVGYAVVSPPDLPQAAEDDLELKRIYVLSRWHGSGLGAALMDAAKAHARATGAARLLLGAYARNRRALAFYRKSGFEAVGERSFTVGGTTYEDDVVLALAL